MQADFAERIGMPVATLRDWERGRCRGLCTKLRSLPQRPKASAISSISSL
ncbi:hypothetical protein [Xenophilus azovorans]